MADLPIECPSGLVVESRKWRLEDMEHLSDEAERSSGSGEDFLCRAASLGFRRTIDPGPYDFIQAGETAFDWKRLVKPDVLWALFRVRAGSFPSDPEKGLTGEHYTFDVRCSNQPACVRSFIAKIRLCDLKVRRMPEASKAVMRTGQPFRLVAPHDPSITIAHRLPTLAGDALLRDYLRLAKRPRARASELLAVHVESITGVKADLASKAKWFAQLDIDQLVPIRNAMSAAGCTFIATVDAKCPSCSTVQAVSLPLGPSFFLPTDPMAETPPEDEQPSDSSGSTGTTKEPPSPGSIAAASGASSSG